MTITNPMYYTDLAALERRSVNIMQVHAGVNAAIDEIARRAGVKSNRVPVFFTDADNTPPTLQWVKRGKILKKTGASFRATHKKRERRVVVGRGWLREHAPALWAAFMAARLHGQSGLIPTLITETEQ